MNLRKIPEKNVILESIRKYKNIKDCILYFNCDYRTFHKWLKHYEIQHNFHKGKSGYWKGKKLSNETKRKISETKKLSPKVLKLKRIKQKCLICGKLYINTPSAKSRRLNKKYCSRECANIGLYRGYKNRKKNLFSFVCGFCGKTFENYKSVNFNKFCSIKCSKEYNRNWKCGKTYDEIYGKEKSEKIKRKIAIKTAERNRTIVPLSKVHKKLKEQMIFEGIYNGFETCQPLYFFEIDEFNKSKKLCIEIDGDYWHSIPKRIQQDKRKDKFLANKGYTIIRIKECDIKNNTQGCIDKIKKKLKEYDKN